MIGTIGCVPGMMSKPAWVMAALKYFVFCSSLSRKAVEAFNNSNTFKDPPTMEGARVLENK